RSATTTVARGEAPPGMVFKEYVPGGTLVMEKTPSAASVLSNCVHADAPTRTTFCPEGRGDRGPRPTTPLTFTPGPEGIPTSMSLSATTIGSGGRPFAGEA